VEELKETINTVWKNIDQVVINRVGYALPKRVKECIRARGEYFE
jgi:hypothetical protein